MSLKKILIKFISSNITNIIDEYVNPNIKKLLIKQKTIINPQLKFKYTIFELVIKSIQMGYTGFAISKFQYSHLNALKKQTANLDNRLEIHDCGNFYFKGSICNNL